MACAKDSKARTPPSASRNGCWVVTSQSAGQEPTSSRSRGAGSGLAGQLQRASAAQPTGEESQVGEQKSFFSSPKSREA